MVFLLVDFVLIIVCGGVCVMLCVCYVFDYLVVCYDCVFTVAV